jgi:hypothetical protein
MQVGTEVEVMREWEELFPIAGMGGSSHDFVA